MSYMIVPTDDDHASHLCLFQPNGHMNGADADADAASSHPSEFKAGEFAFEGKPSSKSSSTRPLPNIVVVMIDDLGWNQVGYHANPQNTRSLHPTSTNMLSAAFKLIAAMPHLVSNAERKTLPYVLLLLYGT